LVCSNGSCVCPSGTSTYGGSSTTCIALAMRRT
jgi:hypothetical protein